MAACGYAPIVPTITLLNDLMAQGVHVAIVSGGSAANAPAFIACLKTNGVKGWSSITFKDAAAAGVTAGRWKASQRAAIRARGWKIVAAIGDQVSDMSYGSAMRGFLLPNTMTYLLTHPQAVGSPACDQAVIPPSRLTRPVKPSSSSRC